MDYGKKYEGRPVIRLQNTKSDTFFKLKSKMRTATQLLLLPGLLLASPAAGVTYNATALNATSPMGTCRTDSQFFSCFVLSFLFFSILFY